MSARVSEAHRKTEPNTVVDQLEAIRFFVTPLVLKEVRELVVEVEVEPGAAVEQIGETEAGVGVRLGQVWVPPSLRRLFTLGGPPPNTKAVQSRCWASG
jgi:hypothetical protein